MRVLCEQRVIAMGKWHDLTHLEHKRIGYGILGILGFVAQVPKGKLR